MMRRLVLAASRSRWLAEHVPRYRFVRATARRFIAGDDIDAALMVASDLARAGAAALVSRLGEDIVAAEEIARVRDHYRCALDRIAEASLTAHISVKLSHLGLTTVSRPGEPGASDDAGVAGLLADLAAHAAGAGSAVWVDMEGSALTDRTIAIFRTVLRRHRNIGICLQAYLYRTERDLEALTAETTAIRLVKGAYNEPPEIAWRRKEDVGAAFHRLALRLLDSTATAAPPRTATAAIADTAAAACTLRCPRASAPACAATPARTLETETRASTRRRSRRSERTTSHWWPASYATPETAA